VARDAIARLYDVDKNSVALDIPNGTIAFQAKKGKSIELEKLHASFQATRLSGRTGMQLLSLQVTVAGRAVAGGQETLLTPAGDGQQFVLGDDPDAPPGEGTKTPFQRLREALAGGQRVVTVTGRLHGWRGPFPTLLRAVPGMAIAGSGQPGPAGTDRRQLLIVESFQISGR
jgi:hypothetical protein